MSVSSRRQREQQTRRQLILGSAKRLFAEKGFENVTVEAIAANAELGKGTIYSYFQSKEEIYIAILEEGLEILEARMIAAIEQSRTAVEALFNLYNTFIEYHHERTGLVETLFIQVDRKDTLRLNSMFNGLQKKASVWIDLIGGVLRQGIDSGEFKTLHVGKTSRMLIGIIIGIIVQHEMTNSGESLEEYREVLFKLVLEGLKKDQHQLSLVK